MGRTKGVFDIVQFEDDAVEEVIYIKKITTDNVSDDKVRDEMKKVNQKSTEEFRLKVKDQGFVNVYSVNSTLKQKRHWREMFDEKNKEKQDDEDKADEEEQVQHDILRAELLQTSNSTISSLSAPPSEVNILQEGQREVIVQTQQQPVLFQNMPEPPLEKRLKRKREESAPQPFIEPSTNVTRSEYAAISSKISNMSSSFQSFMVGINNMYSQRPVEKSILTYLPVLNGITITPKQWFDVYKKLYTSTTKEGDTVYHVLVLEKHTKPSLLNPTIQLSFNHWADQNNISEFHSGINEGDPVVMDACQFLHDVHAPYFNMRYSIPQESILGHKECISLVRELFKGRMRQASNRHSKVRKMNDSFNSMVSKFLC
ncbi:cytosolic 10-formyltetrahydrofolate dehydrogenase [Acrasis kona]|uniref:Cytosolic 10-formyltetrahydrofolate dehydrogenase n=1 Tax=Acrasis kona TaxID=1008807 RepID=A0AAW2YP84_9EUKA